MESNIGDVVEIRRKHINPEYMCIGIFIGYSENYFINILVILQPGHGSQIQEPPYKFNIDGFNMTKEMFKLDDKTMNTLTKYLQIYGV